MVRNLNQIYAIVNESLEKGEYKLTTFLVLYATDFEENVILYDVSRQIHTTVKTDIEVLVKGYIEMINVGMVDRYPFKFYIKEHSDENI
ncbi:hypothetical protein [Cytobacillus gottheilii]|uniref:hypothetical protein n=1 Tax=Cytobacillus gottheilii TaxID=859144 RepID=UPI003CF13EF7